jgi:Uma2 family endonuclease
MVSVSTTVSLQDYFKVLEESEQKLEFHSGEIVAMAGVQPNHAKIHSKILFTLGKCLEAKGCMILGSDLLVKAGNCGNYYFPDLVIVCQKDEYEDSPRGIKALLNPEIIIEILSDSTEAFDRTFKWDCYKTIPVFRKYVLIHSTRKKVEIITKLSEAEWLSRTYEKPEEEIELEGCQLLMEEIYNRVEF